MSTRGEGIAAGNSAGPSSFSRWIRVVPALLIIGGATFVAAYYVPLRRAHMLLIQEQQRSNEKGRELEQTLSQVRGELQAKAAEVDRLEAERQQAAAAKRSGVERVEQLKTDLAGKLDKQIKKGVAAIAAADGHVFVALSESAVFLPSTVDVSPQGQGLLCQVSGALSSIAGQAPLRVGAVSGPPDSVPPALHAAYPTPWELSAVRAATVAQTLQDKCAVAGARLSAVGHAEHDPAAAALGETKLPAGRVEISIALPGASPAQK
ncbi:OmpA/MotB family protein [Sorangium sp. So ce1335]|uniref:OmpA/MotB family protein n=1 Tax=Sorangium sp. So ce1335 TaxID=3133335 RepID=UPI003F5F185B